MPRSNVFVSYSHEDKRWLEKLQPFLKTLERNYGIKPWDDTQIKPGSKWKDEIKKALEQTKVAVLLVSQAFLASEFITDEELTHFLKASEDKGLTILWVAVSPSTWQQSPIAQFQAANDPQRPLDSFSGSRLRNELVKIAQQILRTLEGTAAAAMRNVPPPTSSVDNAKPPRGSARRDLPPFVTGAQASFYERAKTAVRESLPRLQTLVCLDPQADKRDIATAKQAIEQELNKLVEELGKAGGPSESVVDHCFTSLLGLEQSAEGPTEIESNPERVSGTVGLLRDMCSLDSDNFVNTIDDENVYTDFRILVDYITSLYWSWINGVKGAITKRAEEKFVALNADVQAALGEAFKSLVQIDERGSATRRRAALRQSSWSPAAASLIDSLTEARLLVKSSDERGEPVVEVAEEALFTNWPRLARWIADTRDDLRLLRSLSSAASEWEHQERKEEYLWPQRRMAQAYAVIERLRPELNQAERRFLLLTDQEHLLEEIADASTPHQRRAAIGDRLAEIGDTRPGVSLRDGLPDIMWCEIAACEIRLQDTADTLLVEPFRIAKYPTTWAQYLAFLEGGDGYADPSWWDGLVRDEPPGDTSGRAGNRPAEFVSWYDAMAFCRWLSSQLHFEVRLPTEWEWEASATGGEISCRYPWGGEWDPRRANTEESRLNCTTAAGMYPHGASRSGLLDLSGNVWEWCLNQYLTPFDVQQRADRQREIASIEDEASVVSGGQGGGILGRGLMATIVAKPRAVRGGGWSWGHAFACVTRRDRDMPDYRSRDHGFRVASVLAKKR